MGWEARKAVYETKKTGVKKARIQVYVDWSVFKKVLALAPSVYGVYRGALSMAVEDALVSWLHEHAPALGGTSAVYKSSFHQARLEYIKVLEELKRILELPETPHGVSQKDLELAIKNVYGYRDRRAVLKRLQKFHELGFIKPMDIPLQFAFDPRDWKANGRVQLVYRD